MAATYFPRSSPERETRGRKTFVMNNTPAITKNGIVPVLSISPIEEDHFFLQDILNCLQSTLDPSRKFTVNSCATMVSGLGALRKGPFEVVVCERDLPTGSWQDVLEQVTILPDPPSLIVTSRFADERLWAEALNLGAYDVLAKPFNRTEAMRVLDAAWRAWGGLVRLPARRDRLKCKMAATGGTS
jgi:ActR/RegA family two-component response regulator